MNGSLKDEIDVLESGYEFLLAYAAQGRETDDGSEVRSVLTQMQQAAENVVRQLEAGDSAFAWVIADDARKARAAIALVLDQDRIGSELVDNLNVSIHLRALLTDLFLVGEAAASS